MFADDTIAYHTIISLASSGRLTQFRTLGKHGQWNLTQISVKFSEYTDKITVIFPYTLHDTTLRTTENAKYIGVTISSNLIWSSHVKTITNNAKNSLRFIRRNVKTQNKQLKEAAYRTYVRPWSNFVQPYGTHGRNISHIE